MRLALLAVLALLLLFSAAFAGPVNLQGADEDPVVIERDKGHLIRLPRAPGQVFIAEPSIADVQVKSPHLVYVFGQEVGETTLYAVDEGEEIIARKQIVVRHNLSTLRAAVDVLEPENDVKITTVDRSLILSGSVESDEVAENIRQLARRFVGDDAQLINRMEVTGPTQVNLRVRVAEVSRSVAEQIGINWGAAGQSGDFLFQFLGGSLIGGDSFLSRFQLAGNDLSLDILIDLLAEEGLVSVLAEPNLTATSGETAEFLAGGEFPIPVPDQDGRVTIEFREFGVALAFTPTLLGKERIALRVAPEVSELNFGDGVELQGFRIPALTTRRAATAVELGSGQSFAIAGLLQNTMNQDISRVPGLGDVPILGALFRSNRFQRGETELVIIVTPYVVRPASKSEIAAPTDDLVPPTDLDRILFGRFQGTHRANTEGSSESSLIRNGPVRPGFMLE